MTLTHQIIKTIFTFILFIFDSFTLLLTKIFSKKTLVGQTLAINLGALGDNIIFLNSVLQLEKGEKISVLIDQNSKEIFNNKALDDYYYINRKKYIQNIFYRFRINIFFSRYKFNKVITARGSRNGIYEDSIIRFIGGEKIALQSDYNANSLISLKLIDKFVYHKIIRYDLYKNIHELQRMNVLINQTFHNTSKFKILNLNPYFNKILLKRRIKEKYFVLNIGAGKPFRKWDVNKYILLGNKLENQLGITPVYCGLDEDSIRIQKSVIKISKNSLNLCGKTSIDDLINIINFSELTISNDSAGAHISIMLSKKTICIKSNFDKNRFLPYPVHLVNSNIKTLSNKNIQDISIDKVLSEI